MLCRAALRPSAEGLTHGRAASSARTPTCTRHALPHTTDTFAHMVLPRGASTDTRHRAAGRRSCTFSIKRSYRARRSLPCGFGCCLAVHLRAQRSAETRVPWAAARHNSCCSRPPAHIVGGDAIHRSCIMQVGKGSVGQRLQCPTQRACVVRAVRYESRGMLCDGAPSVHCAMGGRCVRPDLKRCMLARCMRHGVCCMVHVA